MEETQEILTETYDDAELVKRTNIITDDKT